MYRSINSTRKTWLLAVAVSLFGVGDVLGSDFAAIQTLVEQGKLNSALGLLTKHVEENPAHERARALLATVYERVNRNDEAASTWKDLLRISHDETLLHEARKARTRLRRMELDKQDSANLSTHTDREDPFQIPMPEIDWTGLDVVEDRGYIPSGLSPPFPDEFPPFAHETEHFTVYSANERLSKVVGRRAEIYLDFMTDKLFGGRSWAVRFPIIVYTDRQDYIRHGAPAGTGGVTFAHVSGATRFILLYQLNASQGGRRGRGGSGIWKYGLESVLPHELTHAVLNEFFAGKPIPRWLQEAIAGRFEQTRDHYGEAARLARKVVAGEFFKMRDLFAQKQYPDRISLFYEQSAAIVLYLFETGPEAMNVFLTELASTGNDHNAACAAAMGIELDNAVDEFERRWVDWMKLRYIKDLDHVENNTQPTELSRGNKKIFQPWVNEVATIDEIDTWRKIDLDQATVFAAPGGRKEDWSVGFGKIRSLDTGDAGASILGIRMDESPPAVVSCVVRYVGELSDSKRLFGFTQLDADLNDTRVSVVAPLPDNQPHTVVCYWADDLAVYIDGRCVGRYPAFHVSGNVRDIDYPIAMVTAGPVEVQNLRVAHIAKFSDKPVVKKEEPKKRAPRSRRKAKKKPEEKKEKMDRKSRRERRKRRTGGG